MLLTTFMICLTWLVTALIVSATITKVAEQACEAAEKVRNYKTSHESFIRYCEAKHVDSDAEPGRADADS